MKLLRTLALLAISLFAVSANYVDKELEIQLATEIQFEEKVKIFDYDGNLLEEYALTDVANNAISSAEYYALQESHYAFNYLGDYYYFTEELKTMGAN